MAVGENVSEPLRANSWATAQPCPILTREKISREALHMFRPARLSLLSLGLLAAVGAPLHAQRALAPDVVGGVLMKVLSYDRALGRNGSGEVVVGIVFDAANPESQRARELVGGAMRNITTLAGRGVRVVELEATAALQPEALEAQQLSAIYITPGLDRHLRALVAAAARSHVTTLGETNDYARNGVAVAVENTGGRPSLLINLPAAREEGADLQSSLLRLATVIQ